MEEQIQFRARQPQSLRTKEKRRFRASQIARWVCNNPMDRYWLGVRSWVQGKPPCKPGRWWHRIRSCPPHQSQRPSTVILIWEMARDSQDSLSTTWWMDTSKICRERVEEEAPEVSPKTSPNNTPTAKAWQLDLSLPRRLCSYPSKRVRTKWQQPCTNSKIWWTIHAIWELERSSLTSCRSKTKTIHKSNKVI